MIQEGKCGEFVLSACFFQLIILFWQCTVYLTLYIRKRAFEMTANFNQSVETGSWQKRRSEIHILLQLSGNKILKYIEVLLNLKRGGKHAHIILDVMLFHSGSRHYNVSFFFAWFAHQNNIWNTLKFPLLRAEQQVIKSPVFCSVRFVAELRRPEGPPSGAPYL